MGYSQSLFAPAYPDHVVSWYRRIGYDGTRLGEAIPALWQGALDVLKHLGWPSARSARTQKAYRLPYRSATDKATYLHLGC